LPEGDDVEIEQWELPPVADVPASIRAEEALFAELPAPFQDALARFDPGRDAIVLAPPFAAIADIDGRPAYGGRRPEWVALEDKTLADELFAAAGIATPAFEIVRAAVDELASAAARLDRGDGTVWAGDATGGFNGGSAYVRWVRDEPDATEAAAHLAPRCARVRVAEFVEGVPCSIHGFVTDEGVAVFRPVELMTLRGSSAPRLRFAGASTFWEPDATDYDAVRDAARRLGHVLSERVDFRGVFTIDGILSADGWVANECNPRFGAALAYTRGLLADASLDLVHHMVIAGDGGAVTAHDLEAAVLPRADERRWGATWIPTAAGWSESTMVPLVGDESGFRAAGAGEETDATLTYGPGSTGGFLRCEFNPERTPIGPSTAPRAVAALAYATACCGAQLPALTAALPRR
jgi:hypothetical protein